MQIPIQKMGGAPPKYENMATVFDASGMVNGVFQPNFNEYSRVRGYPINYVGSWTTVPGEAFVPWYRMISSTPGDRVILISSASRVIFDFWDPTLYNNPGVITMNLDGNDLGTFDLSPKKGVSFQTLDYEIDTGKDSVSTITMTLNSGRVVISGYMLVYK